MTDRAISTLASAGSAAGADELVLNQDAGGGAFSTKRIAVSAFKSGLMASPTFTGAVNLTQSVTGGLINKVENANGGTGAYGAHQLYNGTAYGGLYLHGAGFTTSGVFRQNGTLLDGSGAGGLTLNTSVNQPIYFSVNAIAIGSMTSTGLNGMVIGATTPAPAAFTNITGSLNTVTGQGASGGGWHTILTNAATGGAGIFLANCDWGNMQGGMAFVIKGPVSSLMTIIWQTYINVGVEFQVDGSGNLQARPRNAAINTMYWGITRLSTGA